jgi:nicastrin
MFTQAVSPAFEIKGKPYLFLYIISYNDSFSCGGVRNLQFSTHNNRRKESTELFITYYIVIQHFLLLKDYDWSSGEYPSWTESVWTEISLRMFLKPSRTQEYVTLFSGLLVMAISFVVAYCFSSKGQEFFPTP